MRSEPAFDKHRNSSSKARQQLSYTPIGGGGLRSRTARTQCPQWVESRVWPLISALLGKPGLFMNDAGLAQPTLNLKLIRLAATPVPPLEEQGRIVAKIDELTALGEQLKSCLAVAAETQRNLADVIAQRAAAQCAFA